MLNIRIPTEQDIPRMARVSVLGFQDSEIFRFTRPFYEKFPQDSLASFANWYRNRLRDPNSVVVVAEDWPVDDDSSEQPNHLGSQMVIIGVASWRMPANAQAYDFPDTIIGNNDEAEDRDVCPRRMALFSNATKRAEDKFFRGKAIFDKMVVHPSYRRKGCAKAMVRWGLNVCAAINLDQGVIASHMGQPVYARLGFEVVGEMEVPDDQETRGFTQRVMVCLVPGNLVP